jgi:hypothetical protein
MKKVPSIKHENYLRDRRIAKEWATATIKDIERFEANARKKSNEIINE